MLSCCGIPTGLVALILACKVRKCNSARPHRLYSITFNGGLCENPFTCRDSFNNWVVEIAMQQFLSCVGGGRGLE